MKNPSKRLYEYVTKIIYKILEKENVLQSEWLLGKVDVVVDSKTLKCFINGSATSLTVNCNPDVTFHVGDEIWIICVNNNPINKFALCRRGI